jgi:sigma-B regulation protein RsbU (phosphoserine phosphatase)
MLLSAIGKRKREQAVAEAELSRATKIQFNLLPERIPNIRGFDMKVYYQSAREVGGDYYDFIPIDRENLGIVVADASGKGVPAGMIMTMARTALHLLARGNPSARDVLVRVNRFIAKDIKNVMFLTILYIVLDVRRMTLQVANAGHNPLILWRQGSHRLLSSHGIAVGLDSGPLFEKSIKEELIQIREGDRIIAYTDGVVECMNERDQEFGEERFLDLIAREADKTSTGFLNSLVSELQMHRGRAAQHDDMTVVTFRYG